MKYTCLASRALDIFLLVPCNRSRMTDLSGLTTFILCYFDYLSVWGEEWASESVHIMGYWIEVRIVLEEGRHCMLPCRHWIMYLHLLMGHILSSTHNYNHTPPMVVSHSFPHIHLVEGKTYTEHMDIMSWVTELICTSFSVNSPSLDKVVPLTDNIGLRKWTRQVWPANLALALLLMFWSPNCLFATHVLGTRSNDLLVSTDRMCPLFWVWRSNPPVYFCIAYLLLLCYMRKRKTFVRDIFR